MKSRNLVVEHVILLCQWRHTLKSAEHKTSTLECLGPNSLFEGTSGARGEIADQAKGPRCRFRRPKTGQCARDKDQFSVPGFGMVHEQPLDH